jgi:hypothetical protein
VLALMPHSCIQDDAPIAQNHIHENILDSCLLKLVLQMRLMIPNAVLWLLTGSLLAIRELNNDPHERHMCSLFLLPCLSALLPCVGFLVAWHSGRRGAFFLLAACPLACVIVGCVLASVLLLVMTPCSYYHGWQMRHSRYAVTDRKDALHAVTDRKDALHAPLMAHQEV